jgi:hypothetical protein
MSAERSTTTLEPLYRNGFAKICVSPRPLPTLRGQPPYFPHQGFQGVRLLEEDRAGSDIARRRAAFARSDDDTDPVMMVLDVSRKLEPVQPSGHVDVREHDPDVLALFEDKDRVIGVRGLDHFESGFLENIDRQEPHKGLILNNEDDRRRRRRLCHEEILARARTAELKLAAPDRILADRY